MNRQALRARVKTLPLFAEIEGELEEVEMTLESVLATHDRLVGEVSTHLLRAGGKRIRPALVLLGARFPGANMGPVIPVAVAVELIHMATLVHDDVVDRAMVRRGLPTLNAKWSNQVAVLTGDYLFARAFSLLAANGKPELVRVMADVVYEMSRGELVQIASYFDTEQTEQDYLQRIGQKTAFLIAEACRIGAMVVGAPAEAVQGLYQYGLGLGYSFQIADDLLDLTGSAGTVGKPVCEDLKTGILTMPVLHALAHSVRRHELREMIQCRSLADADITRIKAMLTESGSFEYARAEAHTYLKRSLAQLDLARDLSSRDTLRQLADFVVNRQF